MMIHDDSWWFMMIHTDIGWYLEVSWHLGIFIRPSQNGDAKLIGLGSLNEAAKRALAPMSLMERPCSWYALGESLEAFNLNLKLQSELLPPAILTARPVESVFLKFCQRISEANIVVIHECQHWKWWICPSPLYIYTYIIYICMYLLQIIIFVIHGYYLQHLTKSYKICVWKEYNETICSSSHLDSQRLWKCQVANPSVLHDHLLREYFMQSWGTPPKDHPPTINL